jgi:4'-phosphopantetheinyl transferase EntD
MFNQSSVVVAQGNGEEEDYEEEDDAGTDFLNVQGNSIADWVAREDVRRFVQRKFRRFLETFSSKEALYKKIYRDNLDTMVAGTSIDSESSMVYALVLCR